VPDKPRAAGDGRARRPRLPARDVLCRGIGGAYQSGQIRTYDLQDPIEPREIPVQSPEAWRAWVNFPRATWAARSGCCPPRAHGPGPDRTNARRGGGSRSYFFTQGELVYWQEIRSTPANLLLFDVSEDGCLNGSARRRWPTTWWTASRTVVVKDGIAYVASFGKGLQVVDLSLTRTGFPATGAQFFAINKALSTDGVNPEAVVNTITVTDEQNPALRLPLNDLRVADMVLNGVSRRLIFATGPRQPVGLVIADPADPQPLWRGRLSSPDKGTLDFGYVITLAQVGSKPLALVGGYGNVGDRRFGTGARGARPVAARRSARGRPARANPTILAVLRMGHSVGDILVRGQTAIVSADRGTVDPRPGRDGWRRSST